MSFVSIILVSLITIILQSNPECLCTKLKKDEVIKKGWMSVTLADKPTVKSIQGKIVDAGGKTISDAFVEVFDKHGRIDGCKAGSDGKFCFPNIAKGKYELRVSQEGFDTTSLIITVNPKIKSSSNLDVYLKVSD